MLSNIKKIAAPLALMALFAVAGPASVANAEDTRIRVYKVTADGAGSFNYDLFLPTGPGLSWSEAHHVDFAWHVELPWVGFLSNGEAVLAGQGAAQGTIAGNGNAETTIIGADGHGGTVTTHGYCEAADQTKPATFSRILPDAYTGDPNAGGANITLRPFESVDLEANCTQAVYNGHSTIPVDVTPDQFDQRFFLPTEATRQGKIIQLVDASSQQKDRCADTVQLATCTFNWHGTVTLEFVGYLGEGELTEDDIPELPAGGGATPQPEQGIDDEDLIVPLPSRATLSKRGNTASVNVTCAAACDGTLKAFPAAGVRGAAAKPLAKKRFHVGAGKTVKVKLRFRGAALRKVRRAKAVRLVAQVGKSKRSLVARAR